MIQTSTITYKKNTAPSPVAYHRIEKYLSEHDRKLFQMDALLEAFFISGFSESLTQKYPFLEEIEPEDEKRECLPLTIIIPSSEHSAFLKEFESFEIETERKSREFLIPISTLADERFEVCIPLVFKLTTKKTAPGFTLSEAKVALQNPVEVKTALEVAVTLARFPFLPEPAIHELVCEGSPVPEMSPEEIIESLSYAKRRNLFNGMILGRRPSSALWFLYHVGLLQVFLPELAAGDGVLQNRFHAYDVMEHSIRACDGAYKADLTIRWAALLHDIGKVPTRKEKENGEASFHAHELFSARMAVQIMKRLGIPKSVGSKIRFLVRNHMFHYTDEWSDKAIRRFMKKISSDDLEALIDLRMADRRGSGKRHSFPAALQKLIQHMEEVRAEAAKPKVKDLNINGHELSEHGIPQSKIMGDILKKLLEDYVNGHIQNDNEALLEKALEYYREMKPNAEKQSEAVAR